MKNSLKIFLQDEEVLKESKEFDDAFSDYQNKNNISKLNEPFEGEKREKGQEEKKKDLFSLDEPFKEDCGCIKEDCGCDNLNQNLDTPKKEPYNIEVQPPVEPLNNLEKVTLIMVDEPSDESEKVGSFKPAGTPELSEYDALQEKIYNALEEMLNPSEDDSESEDGNLDMLLKDLEDEDFGRHDYPGSEDKPKGF